jgi:hypothetical protein
LNENAFSPELQTHARAGPNEKPLPAGRPNLRERLQDIRIEVRALKESAPLIAMDSEGSFGMIQITCVEARVHDGPLYRKPSEACWEAFVRAMLTDMPPAPPQTAQTCSVNSGMMAAAG